MNQITTITQFFDRQSPMSFPRPRNPKPFTRTMTISARTGQSIKAKLKDTGTGRIELFDQDQEIEQTLYIQGTDWPELNREAYLLQSILNKGGQS